MDPILVIKPGGGAKLQLAEKSVALAPNEVQRLFEHFGVLAKLQHSQPASIYALARECGADTANLRKVIGFFARLGLVRLEPTVRGGRKTKIPTLTFRHLTVLPGDLWRNSSPQKRANLLARNARR